MDAFWISIAYNTFERHLKSSNKKFERYLKIIGFFIRLIIICISSYFFNFILSHRVINILAKLSTKHNYIYQIYNLPFNTTYISFTSLKKFIPDRAETIHSPMLLLSSLFTIKCNFNVLVLHCPLTCWSTLNGDTGRYKMVLMWPSVPCLRACESIFLNSREYTQGVDRPNKAVLGVTDPLKK